MSRTEVRESNGSDRSSSPYCPLPPSTAIGSQLHRFPTPCHLPPLAANWVSHQPGPIHTPHPPSAITRTVDTAIILSLDFTKSWEEPSFPVNRQLSTIALQKNN